MRTSTAKLTTIAIILAAGCADHHRRAASSSPSDRTDQWATVDADTPPDSTTLEHVTRLSPTIISGSEPVTDADFAAIRDMGATTILSVDGATPDVERARKFGLKYVHIPIAYNALNAYEEVQLERAAHEIEGTIFVHCHHGQHRGPVAAALIYATQTGCSGADAAKILYDAGLPNKYKALHDSLAAFHPGARQLPDPRVVGPLPEIAQRDSLTMAMSDIDRCWERLLECRKNHWQSPPDQPDVAPAHEAAIFAELYRETNRLHLADADRDLRARMGDAEKLAWALNAALLAANHAEADSAADAIAASCTDCHNAHRNN